jgi:hypothetical protein
MWCNAVKIGRKTRHVVTMKARRADGKRIKAQSTVAVRATISFPPDVYEALGEIAKQNRVSLAWVVRDAVDKYAKDKWPILTREGHSS